MADDSNLDQFFESLDEKMREEIQSRTVTPELTNFFNDKNYKGVVQELRHGGKIEANKEIKSIIVSMTGLEYAVYREDLKMAAIFFSFGADPKNNAFDGIIYNMAHFTGHGPPDIIPGFDDTKVPGFDGLNLLLKEDKYRGKAYVWLMKALYQDGTISVHRNLCEFIKNIETVSEELQFSGNDCRDLVRSTLMCMKKIGMSNDIAIRIVEETVLGTLWMLVEKHGLKGCDLEEEDKVERKKMRLSPG